MVFGYSYGVINTMPSQLPLIRRETGENLYPFSVYYVATFIRNVSVILTLVISIRSGLVKCQM